MSPVVMAGILIDIRPNEGGMFGAAEFASAAFSPCRQYRYGLAREWDATRPPLVFLMLNPSTADAFREDPTVCRCISFARAWDYGGLVVLNAYAWRATDPGALLCVADPVGPCNDEYIAAAVLDRDVVVAWGANARLVDAGRPGHLLELLAGRAKTTRCLERTARGEPRHPLYVRGDVTPVAFP